MPDLTKAPYTDFGSMNTAAGYPNRSGIDIKQLWSDTILVEAVEQSVVADITTREHSGELTRGGQGGDNLTFTIAAKPNVRHRSMGGAITYELLKNTTVTIVADQQLEWAFQVDQVDLNRMNKRNIPVWQEEAGKAMAELIDTEMLEYMRLYVDPLNMGNTAGYKSRNVLLGATGSPVAITKANSLTNLIKCTQVLRERQTPLDGNWFFVIPPAYRSCLMESAIQQVSTTGDAESPIRNGKLGKIDHFTLYETNNLTAVTDGGHTCYPVLFGWKKATAFDTIVERTDYFDKMEASWTEAARGLSCYCRKVIWPRHIGRLYCYCTPDA